MTHYIKSGLIAFSLLFTPKSFAHEIGLQMYSLRNQFIEDPAKSLDQSQEWGIKSVEGGREPLLAGRRRTASNFRRWGD